MGLFSWPRLDTDLAAVTPPSKDSYKMSKRFIYSAVNSILKRQTGGLIRQTEGNVGRDKDSLLAMNLVRCTFLKLK